MMALPIFIFLGLLAVGFACWPVLRRADIRGRAVLAAAVALVIFGVGIGVYLMVGNPGLVLRGPDDLRGRTADLALRMRQTPNDWKGWVLLGREYLTLRDGADAAAAFRRAASVAPAAERPAILSAYGEALTFAASGAVTKEAEAAFEAALKSHPKDQAARYFLGLAYASRGEDAKAIAIWENLLADAPAGAPWRSDVAERLAALKVRNPAK